MQKRKFDELISHFNRKVSDMGIDQKYKMELLGMISAIGFAHEKELGTNLAEVGTDCISRQAAIDALRKMQTYKLFSGDDMLLIDQAGAQTELMLLPPIQPVNCSEFPNNSDAISRQAAIDALTEYGNGRAVFISVGEAVIRIEQLPPIQSKLLQPWEVLVAQAVLPQPEIVRCRECKFASGDSRICMKFGHSPIGELDFCSFAERREVNHESN